MTFINIIIIRKGIIALNISFLFKIIIIVMNSTIAFVQMRSAVWFVIVMIGMFMNVHNR